MLASVVHRPSIAEHAPTGVKTHPAIVNGLLNFYFLLLNPKKETSRLHTSKTVYILGADGITRIQHIGSMNDTRCAFKNLSDRLSATHDSLSDVDRAILSASFSG